MNVLNKIKELADEAVKLQNKNRMDEVLREISAMCTEVAGNKLPLKDVDSLKSNDGGKKTESGETGAKPAKPAKGTNDAKGVKADE